MNVCFPKKGESWLGTIYKCSLFEENALFSRLVPDDVKKLVLVCFSTITLSQRTGSLVMSRLFAQRTNICFLGTLKPIVSQVLQSILLQE